MIVQAPISVEAEDERTLLLEGALAQLLARASELDANPRFPRANFESLKRAGVSQPAGVHAWATFAGEVELGRERRRFGGADSRRSFNGAERLALLAPDELRSRERDEDGARRLAYVDVTSAISIDRDWDRASGLRASESHRVEFDVNARAILGEPNEIVGEPWLRAMRCARRLRGQASPTGSSRRRSRRSASAAISTFICPLNLEANPEDG